MIDLVQVNAMSEAQLLELAKKDPTQFAEILQTVLEAIPTQKKECQLAYYEPVNPAARPIHLSTAREIAVVGGNRSSKTDTSMAELAIRLTGHIPRSLEADYPREKLKLPCRARVVCNSLTDTLEPIIKRKLRWDQWEGRGDPGSSMGHWGWIPRHCLSGGSWEKAYSEKYRTLSVAVDNTWYSQTGERWSVTEHSKVQFTSYDQELSTFAGSSLHLVIHDELPPADIYRENQLRTLDVRGQIITAFTPPDEGGVSRADVAWFYDNVYEKGLPGLDKSPIIDTFRLFTEHNVTLDAKTVADMMSRLTEEQREVRMHGNFLHLSGVVYKTFTRTHAYWCFKCQKKIVPVSGTCATCTGDDIEEFTHVIEPHPVPSTWPVVFVIDPHPRKKDAMGWFAITPSDDVIMIREAEIDGTAADVAREVRSIESTYDLRPVKRLMDPNIATETNDKLQRGWTMRKAYDEVGLRCDLANDEMNAGIAQVNELLKPDPKTRRPRFRAFNTCERFVHAMQRFAWDEWSRQGDREPKEMVRDRWKDMPDLIRYLALDRPTYRGYTMGSAGLIHAATSRRRGY